jgi:hypothetical protein
VAARMLRTFCHSDVLGDLVSDAGLASDEHTRSRSSSVCWGNYSRIPLWKTSAQGYLRAPGVTCKSNDSDEDWDDVTFQFDIEAPPRGGGTRPQRRREKNQAGWPRPGGARPVGARACGVGAQRAGACLRVGLSLIEKKPPGKSPPAPQKTGTMRDGPPPCRSALDTGSALGPQFGPRGRQARRGVSLFLGY